MEINLWENRDEQRFFANGKLRWRKLAPDIPDDIVISNDGKLVVLFGSRGIQVLDGETGEAEEWVRESAADALDRPRAAWYSQDGNCYLLASGQLYLLDLIHGERQRVVGEELLRVIRRGEHRAACLQLACIHGVELKGKWVSQPVTFEAAVYAALHGKTTGKHLFEKDIPRHHDAWLLHLRSSPFHQLPTAPQTGPLAPQSDDELISRLKSGDSQAAIDLGSLGSKKAVPHLWKAAHEMPHSATWALIRILGRVAVSRLLQIPNWEHHYIVRNYLSREYHPEIVPILLDRIESGNRELFAALRFQTRVDFGDDISKWRQWYESSESRAETLARLKEPSGVLLLGLQGKKASLDYLKGTPRMIAILPNGAPGNLVFRDGEARRTGGYAIDSVTGWTLADGQPTRFHSFSPSVPMNYRITSQGSPVLEEPKRKERGRWEMEGPMGESLFVKEGGVRLHLRKGTRTNDVGKAHASDFRGYPAVSKIGFAFLNWEEQLEVKDWSGKSLFEGLPCSRSPIFSPDGKLLVVPRGREILLLETEHFEEKSRIQLAIPDFLISSLNFSDDGKFLTLGTEQAFYVWDLHPPLLPENMDLQLATELWLGHRMQDGAARIQSRREYLVRLKTYQREYGRSWLQGNEEFE